MSIRQVIVIILTLLFFTSCKVGYKIENEKVYYEYWNEGSGQGKRWMKQADAKTFQKISFDCRCDFEFGKDKNHLFMNGELMKNIDPNTFKCIGNSIFCDKDSAYFFGFYNDLNDCVIKGVNPNSIELMTYPWAKANNILIHGKDTVYIDDIKEFVSIDDDWGKTKKYIINNNKILFGADVETFKPISDFQGKDKRFNYVFGFINEDDFKKTSYKTFDFDKIDFCESEPLVFIDTHDALVSYTEDKTEKIKLVEKLKSKGFTVSDSNYSNSFGESKLTRVTLTNNKCTCIVEKLYRYDFSKPDSTKNIFIVTERVYCKPK